MLNEG
ncbi:hypothetical protein D030_2449A, partial [Vibrio parahaemolyticus AQ3810]